MRSISGISDSMPCNNWRDYPDLPGGQFHRSEIRLMPASDGAAKIKGLGKIAGDTGTPPHPEIFARAIERLVESVREPRPPQAWQPQRAPSQTANFLRISWVETRLMALRVSYQGQDPGNVSHASPR
jgi:hypothetical protein